MLTFNPKNHEYRWNDVVVPSVTQILNSCGLIDSSWFNEEARMLGEYVHLATALDDQKKLVESSVDPKITPYLKAWRECVAEQFSHICVIEKQRYHPTYGYSGTIDRVVMVEDSALPIVADIKSGSPAPWHRIQLIGYCLLVGCNSGWCVYLDETGYLLRQHSFRQSDYDLFLNCLTIHNWKVKHGYRFDQS